ncbi:cytochrome P450 [Dichomitus squalens LYAD-421 SS1]|uniref:Cytochrome P450 n=1 Tax=Dichomitus squalens (strain LYAD-421) TaxID=732165 RepID=R7STC3_DICSQ|nr:cytochrome P450 [Dichomitus squalens LYAD-421 SS1]EJF59311.1 cytochrome P450 [Dichomitus squalens LYAD-421 SS1]
MTAEPRSLSDSYVVLSVFVLTLFGIFVFGSPKRKYPPGPPAKPLVGNILDVSPQGAWIKFTRYKEVYGDLVFFHGLGNNILVLNSMKAINDLLEKKGSIYSDRPSFTVVGELMGLGQSMPLLPAREEWRAHRKLAYTALNATAVKRYHTIQEDLAAILSKQILDTPQDFFSHVRLTAGRIILSVTYGLSVSTADSEYISHAEDTMHMISKATVPGAFLADLLPWMKHLPSWVPFQQEAKQGREMIERLVTKPFEHVKREMAAGTAPQSLTQDLLSMDAADRTTSEHQIKWTTGALYGAGGETTYSTVLTCLMAMALHPDKLRKAQAELDEIVGTERMPKISDKVNLPYVNAVIKETMRWHPALPLSIARCTSDDDVYEGYDIPKGTIVMPNVWSIAFAKIGPYDPSEFVPERFLETTGAAPIDPMTSWAFGFARRICPGKALGENSVFILIATLLAMFDIAPPDDAELKVAFSKGLVSYPQPFKCKLTPRSASKAAQIVWRASQSVV